MVLEECILGLCVCRGGTSVFFLMDTCQGTIRVWIMVRMTHENNIVGTYPDAHRRETVPQQFSGSLYHNSHSNYMEKSLKSWQNRSDKILKKQEVQFVSKCDLKVNKRLTHVCHDTHPSHISLICYQSFGSTLNACMFSVVCVTWRYNHFNLNV